ncbi:MAG: DUF1684 domain-containing protein [Cyclobacteriaceae bacterium]|nr:DUF1684 domain-containing protein [Cyclobacteriaceae bacterium]
MNKNKVLIIVAGLIATLTLIYSFTGQDDTAYASTIQKLRDDKDRFMRSSPESPFADSSALYTGLKWFDPDKKYQVKARLVPIENKKMITLPTSDKKTKRYMEYAYAEFKLNGSEHRLLILEIIDMGPYKGTLFLAFGDETSARETYGAGRYLDVKKPRGQNTIVLDFNEAYNPYCAYNDKFSCPFPPTENLLTIPIYAGEKISH